MLLIFRFLETAKSLPTHGDEEFLYDEVADDVIVI